MNLDNLDKSKKYLLACSFGPDSMALFHLLLKDGFDFDVAHVNYGLRKEAEDETKLLSIFCDANNIKLFVKKAKVDKNKNIENECRKIRYSFFKKLFDKSNYDGVLVAHNQDDHIETYFMQQKRKNLPKYYGIAANSQVFSINIIRPLLSKSKKELETICLENDVPYSIDSSNLEDNFLRNKIRHDIVEKMSVEERNTIIHEIDDKNKQLKTVFDHIAKSDITNVKTLLGFDDITYLYAINESAKRVLPSISISKKQALEILKVLMSKKPNIVANISQRLCFIKEYDRAYFRLAESSCPFNYQITDRCEYDCKHFYINLMSDTSNLNITDADFPITVRNANLNDRVKISNYEVTVKRLFIDWKMPLSVRKQWPIILDKNLKPIYIPRYQKDFINDGSKNFYVKLK